MSLLPRRMRQLLNLTKIARISLSLSGSYPVKVSALKDLEVHSRDMIRILSHAEIFSFAAFKSLQSENMDSRVLMEILKSMSAAITDAMSIATVQTLGLQQMRREAAIKSAPKGSLIEEAKRKLRFSSFTSKLLFDRLSLTRLLLLPESPIRLNLARIRLNLRRLLRRTSPSLLLDPLVEDHPLGDLVPEVEVLAPPVEEPQPLRNTEVQSPLPLPLPNIPVGGRLAHFAQNWAKITDNEWVLSLIRKGYRISFQELPILSPDPVFFQQPLSQQLEEEVASLLSKGAVEEIIPECPQYYSRIFLVLKKNGKLRLIIDLSVLNHFVYTQTFKMETQRKVKDTIQLNDWAFSLDLTDAYLHIPIHCRSRKYLRFTLRGRVYQFKALPFGLSTSPFVFTHLMTVIATFLRRRVITLHPYLDDWLARNQNRRRLLEHRQFILSLINSLGLIINYEKSDLVPAQVFTFIWMEFRTHINIVRVPQTRQMKILETVRMFSQKTSVSARDFLSLLGQLNSAADLVMLGRLHLRPLQMSLHNQWKPQKLPLCHQIGMTTEILQHLKWWLQEDHYRQGIPLRIDPPSHTISTDASLSGSCGAGGTSVSWSMVRRPIPAQHQCARDESNFSLSITSCSQGKELPCIGVNGQHYSGSLYKASGRDSFPRSFRGGVEHPELVLSSQHTVVSEAHTGQVQHSNRPDVQNGQTDPTEWSLDQEIANKIFQIMDFPLIDLFATRLNQGCHYMCHPYRIRRRYQ